MTRYVLIALSLLLSSCSTPQVTASCRGTEQVLKAVSPLLTAAPETIKAIVTGFRVGSYVCGTPEYAQARESLLQFLSRKGINLKVGD
jgi:hypothetical protein